MNKFLVDLGMLVAKLVATALYVVVMFIVVDLVVDLANGSSERGRKARERVRHIRSRIFAKNGDGHVAPSAPDAKPTCEEDWVI